MKPLIKWPGGKTKELDNIKSLIPESYDRFIEPFAGGGAVYFHLNSDINMINDSDIFSRPFNCKIVIFFRYRSN